MKTYQSVLLIDDDPICNFIHYAIIERLGISTNITIENNGLSALNFVIKSYMKETPLPGLILLDINMSTMDGFEFLEEFEKIPKAFTKDTKIIVVSNLFRKSDIEVLNHKELMYMDKPLTSENLKQMLTKEVHNSRLSIKDSGDIYY